MRALNIDQVGDTVVDKVEELKARGNAIADAARERLTEVSKDLKKRTGDAIDAGEYQIKHNPYTAVSVAAGLGVLAGVAAGIFLGYKWRIGCKD